MLSPETLPANDNILCDVLERLDILRSQLVTAPASFADLVIAALLAEVGTHLAAGRITGGAGQKGKDRAV